MESGKMIIGACAKCGGTIKEDLDNREWSCINCGKTFPIFTDAELKIDRTVVIKEGHQRASSAKLPGSIDPRLSLLKKEVKIVDEDITSDDSEWESLTKGGS